MPNQHRPQFKISRSSIWEEIVNSYRGSSPSFFRFPFVFFFFIHASLSRLSITFFHPLLPCFRLHDFSLNPKLKLRSNSIFTASHQICLVAILSLSHMLYNPFQYYCAVFYITFWQLLCQIYPVLVSETHQFLSGMGLFRWCSCGGVDEGTQQILGVWSTCSGRKGFPPAWGYIGSMCGHTYLKISRLSILFLVFLPLSLMYHVCNEI